MILTLQRFATWNKMQYFVCLDFAFIDFQLIAWVIKKKKGVGLAFFIQQEHDDDVSDAKGCICFFLFCYEFSFECASSWFRIESK